MNFINYSIESSRGVFYTTSKEQKEGYERHEYVDRETKETKVNYRKRISNLKGKLTKFGCRGTQFGERFEMFLEQEDGDVAVLQIPIFRSGTSVNDYIKSMCQYIDNLKTGTTVEIYLNSKNKDKNGYLYKNIFINVDGENLKWAFPIYGDDSPVPSPTKTINKVTKKETWDYSDVDAFFYEKIQRGSTTQEQQNSEAAPKQQQAPINTGDDDLPF